MRLRPALVAALGAALVVGGHAHAAFPSATFPVALVAHDHVHVYSLPDSSSKQIAALVQQSQVEVLGRRGRWTHVRIWASVHGWVRSADLVATKPWETVSTYRAPRITYHVRASPPQPIHASAIVTAAAAVYNQARAVLYHLSAGQKVSVRAWMQDARGTIWYDIGRGWVEGTPIRFLTSDPGLAKSNGRWLWDRVSGKGMWLTLGTMSDSAATALVRAAARNGMTHLYVESAISPWGFHGRDVVGPVIQAAHRQGVAVIAWMYPYLYDIHADVALTRTLAEYRTGAGEQFDGIAADLEENIHLSTVRAYSQLVRAYVGPRYLLVGVTYQPQAFPGYPFAEVAAQYNVIAPMDYWHQTKTMNGVDYGGMRYGYQYGYRYAADSITAIRRVSRHVPVAPIGQTFDNFGKLEMGPHAPSAAEIQGFLAGSKEREAIGVSFFQWMTATDAEWRAIQGYHY